MSLATIQDHSMPRFGAPNQIGDAEHIAHSHHSTRIS
jgi:hypothetical protein